MELIWLIVVVIIIVNTMKKESGKKVRGGQGIPNQQARPSVPNQQVRPSVPNQQVRPSVPNQQARPSVPNQQARPSVPNQQARPSVPNQQTRPEALSQQRWSNSQDASRELKERLQQRYGQQQKSNPNPYNTNNNTYGNSGVKSGENDILSPAAEKVTENAKDELVGQMEADKSSDLMQQVNDLMITGYQANISFERDFLAEGMELLSRYEIGNM